MGKLDARVAALRRDVVEAPCPDPCHGSPPIVDLHAGEAEPVLEPLPLYCRRCRRPSRSIRAIVAELPEGA